MNILKEHPRWRKIVNIGIVIFIILLLSFISRQINEYPINKYQKQFERDDKGVIVGTEGFYLKGNNDKAIILIHGLTDSPKNMNGLAEFFNSKGYSVYVPLLPGHGTTIQDLNNKKYSDWYRAASNALEDADEEERYLVGYSLGGLLALDIASRNDVNAVVTINAPIKLYTRYAPFIPFVKLLEDYIIKDKNRVDELLKEGLSVPYNAIPLNSVSELLKGIKELRLEDIDEPILIMQGIDDDVIDRDSALVIYSGVESKNKKLLFLEDSTHEIIKHEEEGYSQILDFISSF